MLSDQTKNLLHEIIDYSEDREREHFDDYTYDYEEELMADANVTPEQVMEMVDNNTIYDNKEVMEIVGNHIYVKMGLLYKLLREEGAI